MTGHPAVQNFFGTRDRLVAQLPIPPKPVEPKSRIGPSVRTAVHSDHDLLGALTRISGCMVLDLLPARNSLQRFRSTCASASPDSVQRPFSRVSPVLVPISEVIGDRTPWAARHGYVALSRDSGVRK